MTKIGIELLNFNIEFSELQARVLRIEQLGYDSLWTADNIISKDHRTGEYKPTFEAWTTITALSAVTNRIRLGTMVTPARRRHPGLLAKTVSTVDAVSNGRLNLGMGTGDMESYFELWGMGLPSARERVAILREEIMILKRLWSELEVTFEGDYYTLNQANNNPQPVQQPHPPIWLGLVQGRTFMPKLVADTANGLCVYTCSDVAAKQHLDNVRRYCDAIDRDFSSIRTSRCVFLEIAEDEKSLSSVEMNLTATLEEQAKQVKASADPYNKYKKITQRHVIGTPEQVIEQLIGIIDLGFDHIILAGHDNPDSVELFAQEVLPTIQVYQS